MTDNPFDPDYREPEQPSIFDALDREAKPTAPAALPVDIAEAGISRLSSSVYHADPAPEPSLSATLAKIMLRQSPRHAWHASPRLNPEWEQVHKKTFSIGRAAHRAVLGFGDGYVEIPKDILAKNGAASTNEAKAFIEAERKAGRTPLITDEINQIHAMRDILHARLIDYRITLDPARSELTAIAEIDGIWCRAMFDNVPADPNEPIYDFKTCEDASPEACLKAVVNYGYDIQAGHYRAVWKAATGEDRRFVFIFQEKPKPHEATLIGLSGSFSHLAERRATKARRLWRDCISSNNWPGYPVGIHQVDPPAWLIERELQEDYR